MIMDRLV